MKVLIAADGSRHTKRMLAYLAAHEELFGPQHSYTVLNAVSPVPARAAAALTADLLVMGSHGHGTVGNLILGSVATKVMAQCSTPVLLIR